MPINKPIRFTAAVASIAISVGAEAGRFDPISLDVGTSVMYDDNLYRLSSSTKIDDQDPTGKSSKWDQIISPYINLGLKKEYSLQKIEANVRVTDNRYLENDRLDFTALDYDAAWLWQITPSLGGRITVLRTEALNDFGDYTNYSEQSVRTIDIEQLELEYLVGGAWSVVGGAGRLRLKNSSTFEAEGDEEQITQEFGGKYTFSSGTWLKLVQRLGQGDYTSRDADPITQLDSGYDLTETELSGLWLYSGKTSFDIKLAKSKADYDNFGSRDYDEMTGLLGMKWSATNKITLLTSVSRDVSSFLTDTSSYYIVDSLLIAPAWQMTAKTSLALSYQYEKRKYHGAIVPITASQEDEFNTFGITLDWLPTLTSKISAAYEREQRGSNTDTSYQANILTLSAQIGF